MSVVGVIAGAGAAAAIVGGGVAAFVHHHNRSTDVDDVVGSYFKRFDSVKNDDAISAADGEFSVVTAKDNATLTRWVETTHSIERLSAAEQAKDGVLTRTELHDIVAGYAANGTSLTRSERDAFDARYGETSVTSSASTW